ncbi:MAG: hypothetical protein E6J70_15810 [Deltaproteobacteria bacterium]|nr:MAG: hypothetical protein E6J70_15810 [Deltaproteobacteria bacterium]
MISKRLPVRLALTFTRKPASFWRFAKPPSLKTSGCQGSAAYAHSLNASFWSITVAPLAAKRSLTSTIHASLEMTTARRPTGVSSTSMSRTGPKASARPTAWPGGGCSIGVKYALSVEPLTTPAVSAGACSVPPFPSGTSTDPSGAKMNVVLCASGDTAS